MLATSRQLGWQEATSQLWPGLVAVLEDFRGSGMCLRDKQGFWVCGSGCKEVISERCSITSVDTTWPQHCRQGAYRTHCRPASGPQPRSLSSEQSAWLRTEDSAFFREAISASHQACVSVGKGALLWCDNAPAGPPSASCVANGMIVICPWYISATVHFATMWLFIITTLRPLGYDTSPKKI